VVQVAVVPMPQQQQVGQQVTLLQPLHHKVIQVEMELVLLLVTAVEVAVEQELLDKMLLQLPIMVVKVVLVHQLQSQVVQQLVLVN
jgi:hypothetical protein